MLSASPKLHHALTSMYNAPAVLTRTFEVMDFYETQFGVLRAKKAHPEVNIRHVIGPSR